MKSYVIFNVARSNNFSLTKKHTILNNIKNFKF